MANIGQDEKFRRFAWDGFSFEVPEDWDMSWYKMRPRLSTLRMEDTLAIRLEMDWSRRMRTPDSLKVLKSQAALSAAGRGVTVEAVDNMPEGWLSSLYTMPEKRFLATSLLDFPKSGFSCLFRLHFDRTGRRAPLQTLGRLGASFRLHDRGIVPWSVYNAAFECSAGFRLASTSFQAGSKLFVLEWKYRRFFIWFFSLADQLLKDNDIESWCCSFLEKTRYFPARRFEPRGHGRLGAEPRRNRPFGHIEEIARRCFRYKAECRRLPGGNRFVLHVLQYRNEYDIAALNLRIPDAA